MPTSALSTLRHQRPSPRPIFSAIDPWANPNNIALSAGCQTLRWVAKLLAQLGFDFTSIPVYVDNQGAIETTKNGTHSEKTKHIDIAYKYGREALQSGFIELQYCPTEDMLADLLTKALGVEKLERFKKSLGITGHPLRTDQNTGQGTGRTKEQERQ